jgi:hypothetical protein
MLIGNYLRDKPMVGGICLAGSILGVTGRTNADYNLNKVCSMTSRISKPRVIAYAEFHPACQADVRGAWSRPISMRADSKSSPCMARPNLFSGD